MQIKIVHNAELKEKRNEKEHEMKTNKIGIVNGNTHTHEQLLELVCDMRRCEVCGRLVEICTIWDKGAENVT